MVKESNAYIAAVIDIFIKEATFKVASLIIGWHR